MYALHYIIPLIIFLFYRNKTMLYGLIGANLIDLDHIYYRMIGKIGWFESACPSFGMQCSIGYYPLHQWSIFIGALVLSVFLIFFLRSQIFTTPKKRKNGYNLYLKLLFWISAGIILHFILDYLHLLIGFGI